MSDAVRSRTFDVHDQPVVRDFLWRLTSSVSDLREIIPFLIENREQLRDQELARLQAEADELLNRLRQNQSEWLLECISCFKDIVGLHRQLAHKDDKPRKVKS